MPIDAAPVDEQIAVRQYKVQYPLSAYTFPSEARIDQVRSDDEYLHINLIDGRILSLPLWWIPTLHNAASGEREKFTINRERTQIVWDPDTSAINDEVDIRDYLGPGRT